MVEEAPASVDAEHRRIGGIPLRAFAPNAITLLALCSGLTGVRFAIDGDWAAAITMIIVAGVLEGMEIGRASCRERVCQYVSISVVDGSLKKKQTTTRWYQATTS